MNVGAIILMVISLVSIIGFFIFFIIMDFKSHQKQKRKTKNKE